MKTSKSSKITSLTLDEFISRIVIWSHMLFRPEYWKNSAVISFFLPKCYEKRRNSGQKSWSYQKYSRISIWRNFEIRKTSSYEKHRINSKLKISKFHKLRASLWTNVLIAEILAEAICFSDLYSGGNRRILMLTPLSTQKVL